MQHVDRSITRRSLVAAGAAVGIAVALPHVSRAQDATPSPAAGWEYTDVLGTSVSLTAVPVRIAANLVTAAALWDLGIKPVAIFDWTASAYPDGDHIAWGSIPPAEVINIGDADGNVLPEELLKIAPDVVLTMTYDPADPASTLGIHPDLASRIATIAPVLVVTDVDSTEIQLERLEQLAESLGADLAAPAVVSARELYLAKVEEFKAVASEKAGLTTLFIDFDPTAIYIAGPKGVSELKFLSSHGMQFANAGSAAETEFWETLSLEQTLRYTCDVIFNDVYSTVLTLDQLKAEPVFAVMPAVAAGQVGLWTRDFPLNYDGVTEFLETVLSTLRTATDVTP